MSRLLLCALLSVPTTACFTSELDPELSGVFACEVDEDCADPEQQRCISQRCLLNDDVPMVEIISPEPDQLISLADAQATPTFRIEARANFEVVTESEDFEVGKGMVELRLGNLVVPLVEQDGENLVFETAVGGLEPNPGPVRLTLTSGVDLSDDNPEAFDNDEAIARRLFWIDDGRPHVALISPWPGQVFSASQVSNVRFEVSAINVELIPPPADGVHREGEGHSHFYPEIPPEPCRDILNPAGVPTPISPQTSGNRTTCAELREFYEALVGPVDGLNRVFALGTLAARASGEQSLTVAIQQNDHLTALVPGPAGNRVFAISNTVAISRE